MKARRRFTGDSLDLLLDTVCSMFGAITLIAILVALLARSGQAVVKTDGKAEAEILERRIVTAEADLKAAQQLREQPNPVEHPAFAVALTEKRKLTAALEVARARREEATQALVARTSAQDANVSQEVKELAASRSALERRTAELVNTLSSRGQDIARLKSRAEDLEKQLGEERRSRVIALRLPKERARTKRAFSLIVKFGMVYAVCDSTMTRNTRSITWTTDGNRYVSTPIETMGMSPNSDAESIATLLRTVSPSEFYITYFVYPDSITAFRAVRAQAVAAGFDVGFEILPAGNRLIWGPDGTLPSPL